MTNRKKIIVSSIVSLAAVALTSSILIISIVYSHYIERKKTSIFENMTFMALFIDSVAKFEKDKSEFGVDDKAILKQIHNALSDSRLERKTREIVIAIKENENIKFLLKKEKSTKNESFVLTPNSNIAIPIQKALQGQTGVVIALDYLKKEVIAAYMPLDWMNAGLVLKISLSEVRKPFVRAAVICSIALIIIILLGSFFLFKVSNPMIVEIEEQNKFLESSKQIYEVALLKDLPEEVAKVSLSELEKITESEFGWIGELNDQERLDTIAVSDIGWKACDIPEKDRLDILNDMPLNSYWGEILKSGNSEIIDNPSNHQKSRGVPEGHPKIQSFLGVPIKKFGKTVGMVSLANKSKNYTKTDLAVVEKLSVQIWETIRTVRAEIALKKSIQENELYIRKLEQKNKELDEFTYIASHDLQEPLRKLMAFSKLLEKDIDDILNERAQKDLEYIIDAAERMQTLIQDLLSLSRTGRAKMDIGNISLNECIIEVEDLLKDKIEQKNAKFIKTNLPEVRGDKTLLTLVFQNFIQNALKFTDKKEPVIELTYKMENGSAVFGVKDNGIGIQPEYSQQIFQPFKRLHGRYEYSGTGIGLAICKKIIEKHDGQIWVESKINEYTHFKFTIDT